MAKVGDHPAARALLALIALASAIAGQYWLAIAFDPLRAAVGWSVAAAAFVLLYALDAAGRELPAISEAVPTRLEWPLALAVLAIGVFYRTFRIAELPPGLNHDVAWNGLYAVQILQGIPYAPYVAAAWGRETFMFYLQALGIKVFGMELFAMIAPAMAAMILILPLFYWWARSMYGARAALVATLLLATAGWPLVFGRVGWRAVLQPLFTTVTVLFFWRGMQRARIVDFLVSGAALAVTLNTYNGSRTLPLFFPLFAVTYLIRHRRIMDFIRRYGFGILAMMVAFVICVAPLAWWAFHNWAAFQGRAEALWAGPGMLRTNIATALLLFNYRGNGDDFFIHTPLLELPVAVLFVFGVLWCVLRIRDERAVFLLLGMVVSLLPGVVSRPNGNRCIGAMPFVYLLAGLGLLYFVRQAARVGRAGGPLALAVLALGGTAQAAATYREYLSHDRRLVWGFYPETTTLGRYMRTLVGKYAMYVGGANFPRDTLTYFTYPGEGDPMERRYRWLEEVTELLRDPPHAPPGQGVAMILSTIDAAPAVFARMEQRYPNHEIVDLYDPARPDYVFARALLVPPGEVGHVAEPIKQEPPRGEPLWAGGKGADLGKFHSPKGVARDAAGNLYVADTMNHRVQKFTPQGAFVAAWGELGPLEGMFKEPSALAIDRDGNVHVVDTWNNRVQKLSPDGKVLKVYVPPQGFFGPRGIAISGQRLYVTDGGNNRVYIFDLNGTSQGQFGAPGHGPGELFQPTGAAVDDRGQIWIVDSGNNRLQAFTPDGQAVTNVPIPEWSGTDLKEAYVAWTGAGLMLSDPVKGRILQLRGDTLVPLESGPQLEGPAGLAADAGTLYVAERGRHGVTRVTLPKG